MKITVWGGAGFVGSHVGDALSRAGHEVTIADIKPSDWLRSDQHGIQADILDREAVFESLQDAEVVFNFSGVSDIADADRNPSHTASVNILGNLNLLEGCAEKGVRRYIFASSLYVYSVYGGFYRCSKQACENYVEEFHRQRDLEFTILRFGSLYGPRSGRNNAIHRFVESGLRDNRIDYWGRPDALRDYIHVYDAARVCREILESEFANERLTVSGSQTMEVAEVLKMIGEVLGKELTLTFHSESDSGHYEKTPYSFTPRLARKYTPRTQIDLGQGLLEMIEWLDASAVQ